jgi:tetratricopeptide (TPR) repeat protein
MSFTAEQKAARGALLLGRGWFEQGRDERALPHLQKAASLWPDNAQAYRYLAYIQIRAQAYPDALALLLQASARNPGDALLQWEVEQCQALAGELPGPALPSNADGKLRFRQRYEREHHRSGWRYAVQSLYPLHNDNGVRFEDFLEDPFAWQHRHGGIRSGAQILQAILSQDHDAPINAQEKGILPIAEPWIGVLHNPPNMPSGFHPQETPQVILAKDVWRDSMQHCLGLFTLSQYSARWLREATGKPVSALLHPTEIPGTLFDFAAFLDNPDKQVVQVGWWLRRLSAIYELPLPPGNALGYSKLRLVPQFIPHADQYLKNIIALDTRVRPVAAGAPCDNTRECQHLGAAQYDELLSRNIVFIQLYDASANNTVIECIARGTPVLVNPLPAVIEYLGEDYPLYYDSLDEAARKALDVQRLRAAHQHLLENPVRKRLGGDAFRQQVRDSEVYGLL